MISTDIQRKIKEIQIHTRRLMNGALVGDIISAQKGSGFEFDQIREYQQGDDVRFIDWKASARMNKLLVKQYIEERSRTIILAVDISGSQAISSGNQLKADLIAQVASVLALVGQYGNDRVALLLFSDQVELFIPPGKSKHHVYHLMQELFSFKAKNKTSNIEPALVHMARLKKKDAVVFLISDFVVSDFSISLAMVAKKYEIVAIRCLDKNEYMLPSVGLLTVQDPENGHYYTIKSSQQINQFLRARIDTQNNLFKKYGIDYIDVVPDKPFIGDMIRFCRKRMRY